MGSGAFCLFSRVDFFLPASWVGSLCVVGCVCVFIYAGIIFNTRVMGQVAVFGVGRVCDFCMRVLFLVPVQL